MFVFTYIYIKYREQLQKVNPKSRTKLWRVFSDEERPKTAGKLLHVYLLRWCDALLFVELGALFGFAVQAEALFKGLLLQHQSGAEPEVVCLSQVLQHTRADRNRRNALGHGFHKAVQGTGLAVPLSQVAAAAQERTHFPWQSLKKQRYTAYHTNHLHLTNN